MPSQDEAGVRAAYDEVAATYARLFPGTEPEQAPEMAMLHHGIAALGERPQVLDAGCGAGRLLTHLAALGCSVEGIDLSPRMVQHARRDHPHVPVAIGSLLALPYPDQAFDGYVAWYSTIHLSDDELPVWLDEAIRVVRPGGLLVAAFQAGAGTRDVAPAYESVGHSVVLERYNRTVEQFVTLMKSRELTPWAQMTRAPVGPERDSQGVVVAKRVG